MSYNSLTAAALRRELLDGSTTGTVTGTTTWASAQFGRQGFSFDGATQLLFATTTEITGTASIFFRMQDDSPSSFSTIAGFRRGWDITGLVYRSDVTAWRHSRPNQSNQTLSPTYEALNGTWRNFCWVSKSTTAEVYEGDTLVASITGLAAAGTWKFNELGSLNGGNFFSGVLGDILILDREPTSGERLDYAAGPEPLNTVAPTLNSAGDWTVGTWDSQGNGSLTYTVTLHDDADDSLVATIQTDSATTSGNCLSDLETAGAGTYYITVAASNDGGNDAASDTDSAATLYAGPATQNTETQSHGIKTGQVFEIQSLGDIVAVSEQLIEDEKYNATVIGGNDLAMMVLEDSEIPIDYINLSKFNKKFKY